MTVNHITLMLPTLALGLVAILALASLPLVRVATLALAVVATIALVVARIDGVDLVTYVLTH